MRTSFVNGLALLAFVAVSTGACSHADGRDQNALAQTKRSTDSLIAKADLGRIEGSPSAKVWVVEISDFQCPYCKEWHDQTYPVVRDEFVKTGKVRLAFVNFPLSQHQNAMHAAEAAMCASVQGKFWTMQDSLFATQYSWGESPNPAPVLESLAAKVGVNIPAWKSCLAVKSIHDLVQADMDRARRAGTASTPTFIVGGKLVEGALPPDAMRKAINEALGAKK
jgi:protein-disulfide isomerase